ncbi:MAG: hypothetical protein IPG25_05225 [Proteobacteria bacterium]|nr:hypothetical protein [Pseudomonadota bacterium]
MRQSHSRWQTVAATALCTAFCGTPALADDTEIFVDPSAAAGIRPNIVLVIDTSLSMNAQVDVPRLPYDPDGKYPGGCRPFTTYVSSGSGAALPRLRRRHHTRDCGLGHQMSRRRRQHFVGRLLDRQGAAVRQRNGNLERDANRRS